MLAAKPDDIAASLRGVERDLEGKPRALSRQRVRRQRGAGLCRWRLCNRKLAAKYGEGSRAKSGAYKMCEILPWRS
jgi:hypothetical protein